MSRPTPPHIDTLLQHAASAPFDAQTGNAPVSTPSVRTSTVRFRDLAALEQAEARKHAGERVNTYGRVGMQTHAELEAILATMEGGTHCSLASSGLAAMTLVCLTMLSADDHMLAVDCVYGPLRSLHKEVLSRLGIEVSYFTPGQDDVAALIRPNTKLLYLESPGSLLFEMQDLPAMSALAHARGVPVVVDNTWGSGYIYRPLTLGADISLMAATKYVGGHSDLMMGAVVAREAELGQRLARTHYALGYSVSADDAWLAMRGMRTLPVRMAQHARNALEVCEFLSTRPEVVRIFHPAWPEDAGYDLWARDCTGSNGMLSVELRLSTPASKAFVDALTLFGIGFSWGGFESLAQWIDPHALASHGAWTGGENTAVRLHVGLESIADLIADLAQALDRASAMG